MLVNFVVFLVKANECNNDIFLASTKHALTDVPILVNFETKITLNRDNTFILFFLRGSSPLPCLTCEMTLSLPYPVRFYVLAMNIST